MITNLIRDVDEGFNANDRRKIKLIKKIMDVFKDKTIDEINKKQCSSENDEQKDNYNKLRELIKEMIPDNQEELIDKGTEWLEETGVSDITEYARSVHAEMEALMSCTRTGVSTRNCTLYCTTFPCHNCAKHYSCIRNKEGCIC